MNRMITFFLVHCGLYDPLNCIFFNLETAIMMEIYLCLRQKETKRKKKVILEKDARKKLLCSTITLL